MCTIYYDLSEQFLASGLKFKYYGIARTVMEVGYELAQMDADIRFVIFSPVHDRFFEVTPRIGSDSPTGVLDPGLPRSATPIRMRYSFPRPNQVRHTIYPALQHIVRRINKRRWQTVPEGSVREVNLDGQILVSLGRPKLMADYLTAMRREGVHIKLIPLLHDMIPIYEFAHPSQSMFANNFTHDNHIVVQNAYRILANSVFTKTEIKRFSASGHLPAVSDVVAVPLAHELRPTNETVTLKGPDVPYLLGVGVMTGRKNLECLLDALLHLQATDRPVPSVVLAGARRKRSEKLLKNPKYSAICERVHFILDPNQAELRALYKSALALVLPSHLEGWGLPLGEALWLGTPGIASTATVLKEVGGDLAEYFDPNDPKALAALIDRLHTDPEHYRNRKAYIASRHGSLRTWKNVADDIMSAVKATF